MKTVTFSEPDCCPQQPVTRNRTVLPASVNEPYFVYEKPLDSFAARQKALEFKAALARRIASNPEKFDVKVGIVTSPAPGVQYVQGVGSSVVPGNLTRYRRPIRSATWSALTPGGSNRSILGRLGAHAFGAVKPERGYRCPEGFQFGGQFTNEQYTTCGKQLFALPAMLIARALGLRGRRPGERNIGFQELAVRSYRQQMYPLGTPLSSRSADIPKVGQLNTNLVEDAEDAIYGAMAGTEKPATRLIRQDGFVLEPVVSAAVLRTVPDNRNMEGAIYAINVSSPNQIGRDELGLLSNSGVRKITYVLPNGGTLQLSKARDLTVGERRKLGKTVSMAEKMPLSNDPAARLRFISGEMGDGIQYGEKLNIKNPNDLISVRTASGAKKMVRRWHHEAFAARRKPKTVESVTSNRSPEKGDMITNLAAAVRHLNSGGDIGRVAASIRTTAMKRSSLYKTRKFKDGVNVFERGDGTTFYEMMPNADYEHIGAIMSAEIQQSLGVAAPEVYRLGSGKRSPYLVTQAQDSFGRGNVSRNAFNNLPVEDMLAIAVSDYLTDTRSRNPSNIQPVKIAGRLRAIPSTNPGALIGKMNTRYDIDLPNFFQRDLQNQWKEYFDQISAEQKKKVLELLTHLLERARSTSISEISSRISVDGDLSSAEKAHMKAVENLYESRLKRLSASKKLFAKIIGA